MTNLNQVRFQSDLCCLKWLSRTYGDKRNLLKQAS